MNHKGLRYNTGKLKMSLLPRYANNELAKIITRGSEKYLPRNWENGMAWTTVLDSLKRHLLEFENCKDYDPETQCLHIAHVMCNAAFLTEYYKIYPQGDDRPHYYLNNFKIGLDIDDVLADFITAYCKRYNIEIPYNWKYDVNFKENYDKLLSDEDFWMNLEPKIKPEHIPFEIDCYISSRLIPEEWTVKWLEKHNFSIAKVFHTTNKLEKCKERGLTFFVDDNFETFQNLNSNGICCYLMTVKHNEKYQVGHKRINSINDLEFLIK